MVVGNMTVFKVRHFDGRHVGSRHRNVSPKVFPNFLAESEYCKICRHQVLLETAAADGHHDEEVHRSAAVTAGAGFVGFVRQLVVDSPPLVVDWR
jgi:hypothetical protein